MQQATDFLEESHDLYALAGSLDDAGLRQVTDFKAWTVETIIRHLHFWNRMARNALIDTETFQRELVPVMEALGCGESLTVAEEAAVPERGCALVRAWLKQFEELATVYMQADSSQRCAWVGPSMSARSCITARQMETWAHGQEIYDLLGRCRENTDRIRNIVVLGIKTYGWTFSVRGEAPPEPRPWVSLTAPSGDVWQFGKPRKDHWIKGSAEQFAQVVTQTRNVADTDLAYEGDNATRWMQNAQCFAGGVSQPPAPGTRFMRGG